MAEIPNFPYMLSTMNPQVVKGFVKSNLLEHDGQFEEVSPEDMLNQPKDSPIFLYIWYLGADKKNEYKIESAEKKGNTITIKVKHPKTFIGQKIFKFRDDKKDEERPYVKFYRLPGSKDYLTRLQTIQQNVPDQYLPPEMKAHIVGMLTEPKKKAGTRRKRSKTRRNKKTRKGVNGW